MYLYMCLRIYTLIYVYIYSLCAYIFDIGLTAEDSGITLCYVFRG